MKQPTTQYLILKWKKNPQNLINLVTMISGSFWTVIYIFCWILQILQLKKKLKEYEEKNMVPGASNMISSEKQAEFKR